MDVFDALVQELDKELVQKRDWVANGQAKDFADYQRMCGEIHGLLIARQEVLDLKQKTEHSDE
ncbi:MAG: hypothetical protein EB120_09670 [Proteobacteria bacterium]|jgi:hypothetical protein|nr:hypothetical protein [Pseudomonadota bacterium]